MQKVIIMNYICLWGILASITGIAIMFSVIKHKKSVSAIKMALTYALTFWIIAINQVTISIQVSLLFSCLLQQSLLPTRKLGL